MASSKNTIVETLAQVKNVGPSYAEKMYDELEIRSVEDLAEAARTGRLKQIKGIGPAKQDAILEAAEAELREPQKAVPVDATKAAAELSEQAKAVGEKQREEAKKEKKQKKQQKQAEGKKANGKKADQAGGSGAKTKQPARAPESKKPAEAKSSSDRTNNGERKTAPRTERPGASQKKDSTSIPGLIFKIARKLVGRILK